MNLINDAKKIFNPSLGKSLAKLSLIPLFTSSIQVTISNPEYRLGEDIFGFVTLNIEEPTFIKEINVFIEGYCFTNYTTKQRKNIFQNGNEKKTIITPTHAKIFLFASDKVSVNDEKHNIHDKCITEFAPGKYHYPYTMKLPESIPSSFTFPEKDNVCLEYYVIAESVDKDGKKMYSKGERVPICVNPCRHNPQQRIFMSSSDIYEMKVIVSDETPAVGDVIDVQMICKNNAKGLMKLNAEFLAVHKYKTIVKKYSVECLEFSTIQVKDQIDEVIKVQIPPDFPISFSYNNFEVKTYLRIIGEAGRRSVDVSFELKIGYDIVSMENIDKRIQSFGGRRTIISGRDDFSYHFRQPPKYDLISSYMYPNCVERIILPNGEDFYVSYLTSQTSDSPEMLTPSKYINPCYHCVGLPQGWSIGKDFGEWYFIDHINKVTQWQDPRPMNERVVEHISKGINAVFEVELLEVVGVPVHGVFVPNTYARMMDYDGKWKETSCGENNLDPKFTKNNKIAITVGTNRRNVVLYFNNYLGFAIKPMYLGGINFDLQYIPSNVIFEDWIQLDAFGNNHFSVTGKALIRFCYKTMFINETYAYKIYGHSNVFNDYYPNSYLMQEQIDKQNVLRKQRILNHLQ